MAQPIEKPFVEAAKRSATCAPRLRFVRIVHSELPGSSDNVPIARVKAMVPPTSALSNHPLNRRPSHRRTSSEPPTRALNDASTANPSSTPRLSEADKQLAPIPAEPPSAAPSAAASLPTVVRPRRGHQRSHSTPPPSPASIRSKAAVPEMTAQPNGNQVLSLTAAHLSTSSAGLLVAAARKLIF